MKKGILNAIAISLIGITTHAQGFNQIQKVTAEDRDTEDRMGWAVDMSDNYAIVGAYGDDYGAVNPNMGSAHIYEKDGDGTWVFAQKIFNSDQDDYDRFGWAVAINGDMAVIGAYGEDEDVDDDNNLSKAGSVYVFERAGDGTWNETQKLVASDRAEGDEFGFSVAIHGDLIVVGAHYNNTNAAGEDYSLHAGAAYIFEQNDEGEWEELQKLVASDRFGNPGFEFDEEDWNWRYGESVGVFNDYVVVGSPFAAKGYVYERTGDTWTEADQLTYPGIATLDRAGIVSIDQTTILLGAQTWDYSEEWGEDDLMNAGGAAIFDRTGGGDWNFTQMIVAGDRSAGDHFGISVSLEGDYIVSGAHQDNHDEDTEDDLENAGSAYMFKKIDGTWTQIDKVDNTDRAIEDQLGIAVAISGSTALVGAYQQDLPSGGGSYLEDAGAAYFYIDEDDDGCPTEYSSQSPSICDGEVFEVGDSDYTESGTYTDVLTSIDGCDSIVTTYLNVITDEPYEYEATICSGQSVFVGDSEYTEAGTYTDIFATDAGCDSIVETTVILIPGIADNTIEDEGFGIITTAFGMASYQWYTCDPFEIIPFEMGPILISPEDGSYAIVVVNEGGCVDTSDCYTVGDGGGPGDDLVVPAGGVGPTQENCNGTIFDSGGSASNYSPGENGQITIAPTGAATVELTFVDFDVEAGDVSCMFDRLNIYDGPSTSDPLLGSYCNSNPPPATLSSTGPSITLQFESDDISSLAGFEIDWACEASTDGLDEDEQMSFSIYPNPNQGNFTIDLGTNQTAVLVEITNELGQVVYSSQLSQANNLIQMPRVAPGMYIARIVGENTQAYKRFVIN